MPHVPAGAAPRLLQFRPSEGAQRRVLWRQRPSPWALMMLSAFLSRAYWLKAPAALTVPKWAPPSCRMKARFSTPFRSLWNGAHGAVSLAGGDEQGAVWRGLGYSLSSTATPPRRRKHIGGNASNGLPLPSTPELPPTDRGHLPEGPSCTCQARGHPSPERKAHGHPLAGSTATEVSPPEARFHSQPSPCGGSGSEGHANVQRVSAASRLPQPTKASQANTSVLHASLTTQATHTRLFS